ncbi:MAG TPA: hypothetical protein VNT42_06730 [Sphingomonas sp.]|nr:hypothetical protein [Sphingomonas sp.]
MSDIPFRADKVDAIDLQTRKLIDDATRAANVQSGELVQRARQIVADRKQRERYFDPMLFSNPAWDILLGLYVAGAEGQAVHALDLCLTSNMPQSVTLRWAAYLQQEDMVIETPNPVEGRPTLMRLTDQTRMAIAAYLGSISNPPSDRRRHS